MNSNGTDLPNTSNRTSKLKHAEITDGIIGAFYEVYNELGHGFLESVYRDALSLALQSRGTWVDREKAVQVKFRGQIDTDSHGFSFDHCPESFGETEDARRS